MSPELRTFQLNKKTVEKYELRNIPEGLSWADFTIDCETGSLDIQSDWGEYSYMWSSPGGEFKHFLRKLNSSYLLDKMATRDWYDGYQYQKECIISAKQMYVDHEITKDQYSELLTIFNDCIDFSYSKDTAQTQINEQKLIDEITQGEWWYSFGYDSEYKPNAKTMFTKVFMIFQAVLDAEIEGIKLEDQDLMKFIKEETIQEVEGPSGAVDLVAYYEDSCKDLGETPNPEFYTMNPLDRQVFIMEWEDNVDERNGN